MKIGIIGSGQVGQVLAKAFIAEGHVVTLGTRNHLKVEVVKFKNENNAVAIANFADTAKFGELIVLATNGEATLEIVKGIDASNFKNKIIIDATNPIAKTAPVNGVLQFFTGPNESLMEKIQQLLSEARLVKAFNSVGSGLMYKPVFKGGPPTMFIAGNDENAKDTVRDILTHFGWETEDMGKAEAARAIEPLCILWCLPGFTKNQWSHAFKLLKV
ncbi:MAG: NADPH-dependent F420 reductase [Chitinophagaceae bacterium]